MRVYEAVAHALRDAEVEVMFGLLGSGNLQLANAAAARGITFYSARHEGGALAMAESYARLSGGPAVCTFHQGPGLTNTITGLAEAVKSRTPIVMLVADTRQSDTRSEFRIDQRTLVNSIGVVDEPLPGPDSVRECIVRALRRAATDRCTVAVMLATDVQQRQCQLRPPPPTPRVYAPMASPEAIRTAVEAIEHSERPAILVGRGAIAPAMRDRLEALGQMIGAVMGTTALAKGFFGGSAFDVGVVGGYSTAVARKLMLGADLVIAFGASLNHRTTDAGATFSQAAKIIQIDLDAGVFGAQGRADLGIVSDAEAAACALVDELTKRRHANAGFRTPEIETEIATNSWHAIALPDRDDGPRIDPRRLSAALNRLLPANRTVVLDSGVFQTYPFAYLDAPDPDGFVFVHSFMAVGFGLGNAVGAAIARPDRLTVAAVGDGGALMAMPELETIVRYRLPILVVVYNDAAYGAEAERCRLFGEPVDLVTYPETNFAALGRALGYQSATVRAEPDLEPLREWASNPDGPFLIDAKIDGDVWAGWFGDRFEESWRSEARP